MITANFSAYDTYVTDSVHQWDINRVLSVTGLNISVTPEIHFSNAIMAKAIVRQATLVDHIVTVTIPNTLLQHPLPIEAHIGIYEGDAFKIIEKVRIPVIAKARPEDYSFEDTEGEIYSYNALENMVTDAKNKYDGAAEMVSLSVDLLTESNSKLMSATAKCDDATEAYKAASALAEQFLENNGDVVATLNNKANKAITTQNTLSATRWSGNTYSFEDGAPSNSFDIEIALDNSATAEQVEAFNSAQIVGSATSNVLKAFGTVPTIDIPIIYKAVFK